ncbi:MAG TPA: NmrA family NAD(P)-binding protein [Thermodesulfovibrionales bacterium]|nr:NmrA family NAD(P)-binding protein [Thermodesulfovibrionales bacterium]
MRVLVIGGTGTVGSQVVYALLAREVVVRVLTRNADKAKGLPVGVEGVIGDLLDPATIRSVFKDIDSVFMLLAVSTTETHEGLMAVNGMRMSGVKHIAYMSVHNLEQALHLPHFGSKLPVEAALKTSGIPYTILRPNNFFQNDYWFRDAMIKNSIYPQPIGDVGLSRVDIRDIAEAAAVVVMTPGHEGRTYNLVGPDVHTGKSTAEAWGRALGKTISYGGNNLEAWEQQSLQSLPAWMVFDFKLMYSFFQDKGLKASQSDIEHLTKLLGHPPRSFGDFAIETARGWKT